MAKVFRQDELHLIHTADSGRVTVIRLTEVSFKHSSSSLESVDSGFWYDTGRLLKEYQATLRVKKAELELRPDQRVARKITRLLEKLHSQRST